MGLTIMEENSSAMWSNNQTTLIVVKSKENSGKTTTVWMVLFELVNQGAKIINLRYVDSDQTFSLPHQIPDVNNRHDFVAELEWQGKRIIILSHGDLKYVVEKEIDAILQTYPDFVVCASRSQWRSNSTWELFEYKYTNIHFRRVCFWSEYAKNSKDELKVKEPTVEAIVKFIKP